MHGLQTQTENCGQGLEGYGGDSILTRVHRIRQNGGVLRYVQMDEPIVGQSGSTDQGLLQRYREGTKLFRALAGRPLSSFTADVNPKRPRAIEQHVARF